MRLDDLREELQAIADEAPPISHGVSSVVRSAVRRLRTRRVLAGVVAAAVAAGGFAAVTRDGRAHRRLSIAGSGPSGTTPSPSTATIADGHWSAIAPLPLEPRTDASVIWTGSLMIVWGGHQDDHVLGNGAAYDPDTNSWRALPPAPISARAAASAVWTGREMIVWGGDRKFVGDYASDGAAFDPVAWTWRRIAAAPLAPRYRADMMWTGTEAIVFGGYETNTGDLTSALDAAAYDPATDRWRPIASLPGVNGAAIETLSFVWTGKRLLVWELWSRATNALGSFGRQLVEYDPSADALQRGPEPDNPHRNVYAPIWTGHEVIAPAVAPLCDLPDGAQNCGPPPPDLHGSTFDPATGAWASMPHGPADDGQAESVWTGDDLVAFSSGLNDSLTGKTTIRPGTAAAWNPTSNTWTTLPRAPSVPGLPTSFWTGRQILVWGTDGGVRYDLARSR